MNQILKKIGIVLIILITNISFSQINEGKVTYNASDDYSNLFEKMENTPNFTEQQKTSLLEKVMNSSDVIFELVFNSNESLFYYVSGIEKGNLTSISSGTSNLYYTNLKTEEVYRQRSSYNKLLIIEEPLAWELTQETKKIGKYNCYKATTTRIAQNRNKIMKRAIIAWYTPEIPITYGIQNLNGLSGLILELSVENTAVKTTFKAINIELNPKEEVLFERPQGKKITSQEFIETLRNAQ